jgi:hypothetical protein
MLLKKLFGLLDRPTYININNMFNTIIIIYILN